MVTRRFSHLIVAGGAGFIGSHFTRLAAQAHPRLEITVLDKLTYAGNLANLADLEGRPGYRFVRGDICDRGLVDSLAQSADGIVNFAAETHVDRSLLDPFTFIETDTRGTAVLCEAAVRHNHKAFLQVSTDEVYGEVLDGAASEEDRLAPRNPYAAAKAGGELMARSYSESFGLTVLVTRGSNTYGPNQYPEKIIPLFVTNALDDRTLPLYGAGDAVRDYLYVDDHARAIALVLFRGANGVYNVGTGTHQSGRAVARAVLRELDKPESLIERVADRRGHDRRYSVQTARIRKLGWAPEVAFADGLARTVAWYREHESWWRPLKSAEFWEFYKRNYRAVSEL